MMVIFRGAIYFSHDAGPGATHSGTPAEARRYESEPVGDAG